MTLRGFAIAVYGYTDDIGTQTYNLQLSQRRAKAVRDFLVQAGISPTIMSTNMSTKGFGRSDPRRPATVDAMVAERFSRASVFLLLQIVRTRLEESLSHSLRRSSST